MDIESLTVKQVREIAGLCGSKTKRGYEPIARVGQAIFIRTVTHHYTGRVTKCNRDWLELEDAAWIADDGRFHDFLKTGNANEVEPFVNNVRIPTGCILDVTEWAKALPRDQK